MLLPEQAAASAAETLTLLGFDAGAEEQEGQPMSRPTKKEEAQVEVRVLDAADQERAAAEDPTLPVETAAAHLPRPGRIGAVRIVPRHP